MMAVSRTERPTTRGPASPSRHPRTSGRAPCHSGGTRSCPRRCPRYASVEPTAQPSTERPTAQATTTPPRATEPQPRFVQQLRTGTQLDRRAEHDGTGGPSHAPPGEGPVPGNPARLLCRLGVVGSVVWCVRARSARAGGAGGRVSPGSRRRSRCREGEARRDDALRRAVLSRLDAYADVALTPGSVGRKPTWACDQRRTSGRGHGNQG